MALNATIIQDSLFLNTGGVHYGVIEIDADLMTKAKVVDYAYENNSLSFGYIGHLHLDLLTFRLLALDNE